MLIILHYFYLGNRHHRRWSAFKSEGALYLPLTLGGIFLKCHSVLPPSWREDAERRECTSYIVCSMNPIGLVKPSVCLSVGPSVCLSVCPSHADTVSNQNDSSYDPYYIRTICSFSRDQEPFSLPICLPADVCSVMCRFGVTSMAFTGLLAHTARHLVSLFHDRTPGLDLLPVASKSSIQTTNNRLIRSSMSTNNTKSFLSRDA